MNLTCVQPELDVFHSHREQFVHAERVSFHHKDFIFMSSMVNREVDVIRERFISLYVLFTIKRVWFYLDLASFSPFFQSQMTME